MQNNMDVTLSAKKRALMLKKLREKVAKKKASSGLDTLVKQSREQRLPLSYTQQRLWFLDKLDKAAGASYHMPLALRLNGMIDKEALTKTFITLIERHEVLRTRFDDELGDPYLVIDDRLDNFEVNHVDLTHLAKDAQAQQLEVINQQSVETAFDLANGPLIRAMLVALSAQEHVLLVTQHHIISDGWSMNIIVGEMATIYNGFVNQQAAPLPSLAVQYADYAAWQKQWLQGDNLAEQLKFWQQYLHNAPTLLSLPYDKTRPSHQSFTGHDIPFELSAELTANIRAFSQHHGVTIFMTMLAAWSVMLSKLSGDTSIISGTPIANRPNKALESLLGYFANTLALRVNVDGSMTVKELFLHVKQQTVSAYQYQQVPFDLVVDELQPERSLAHSPIYQVMISMNNTPGEQDMSLNGLSMSPIEQEQTSAQFDLSLSLTDMGETIVGTIQYVTDLFEKSSVERYAGYFNTLLKAFISNDLQRVADIEMLDLAERNQLIHLGQGKQVEIDFKQPIHSFFEQQVSRSPSKVALCFDHESMTYQVLNAQANQLARKFKMDGVGDNAKVAFVLERGFSPIITMLASLKTGAMFVPIDATYPDERIEYILQDCQPDIVVTQQDFVDRLSSYSYKQLVLDNHSTINELALLDEHNLIQSVRDYTHIAAYMIYTSGSTGKPKGVIVEHGNTVNLMRGHLDIAGLTPKDVVMQFSSYGFDVAIGEIFPSLSIGATLVIRPSEMVAPDKHFSALIDEHQISVCDLPTAFWQQWVQLLKQSNTQVNNSLRLVIVGGEKAQTEQLNAWNNVSGECHWLNGYGPTEATVTTTAYLHDKKDTLSGEIPIGRPLVNTEIQLLDDHGKMVPMGSVGEICIGGFSVARGYLNQAELTGAKFIQNPSKPEQRLYKTGDLAKWGIDGQLHYLGRNDFQVKIRGFRIELGEIENQLLNHPLVKMAFVTSVTQESNDNALVAYLVKQEQQTLTVAEIKSHLKQTLTEYMVPSGFAFVDELPLTANGKVDVTALPSIEVKRQQANYLAPATETEKQLALIWQELLGVERIGLNDHFFQTGGHSLLAVQLMSRIAHELNVEVELKQLFAFPVLADFTEIVVEQGKTQLTKIKSVARQELIPLSYAQQRLWLTDKLSDSASGTNHMTTGLRINGALDKSAMQRALNTVIERHESLRTCFKEVDGTPYQFIKPLPCSFTLEEMAIAIDSVESEQKVEHLCQRFALAPFDFIQGPLIRGLLIEVAPDDHVLMIVKHHIITDGWSTDIFIGEISALYHAYSTGKSNPLPELDIQYADYSMWQKTHLNEEKLEQQKAFWTQYLADTPDVIQIPTDRPRTQSRNQQGLSVDLTIDKVTSTKLKQLSESHGCTLYMTLMGAWACYLSKLSGQNDIVIGTPVANRPSYQLESLIGFFVNTLAMRFQINSDLNVSDVVESAKQNILNAFTHQDLPFDQVVELVKPQRSTSHTPLFQVLFNWQGEEKDAEMVIEGLAIEPLSQQNEDTQFDLSLFLKDTGDVIIGSWRFTTDIYDEQTIESMSENFLHFLKGFTCLSNKAIRDISILSPAQRQTLTRFNQPIRECDTHLVHEVFSLQSQRHPDTKAVVAQGRQLTFKQLEQKSNQIAHLLKQNQINTGDIVALCFERSVEMIAAIFGVLKVGAAYLPIDASAPLQRAQYIVSDSGAKCVLCHQKTTTLAQQLNVECLNIFDNTWQAIESFDQDAGPKLINLKSTDLAYIIYTSGSTGNAKGVMIEHHSPVNFWQAMEQKIYGELGSDIHVALNASYAFDMSLKGILQLLSGRTVYLIPQEIRADGQALISYFEQHQIDAFDCTPSQLKVLLNAGLMSQLNWAPKAVLIGGEAIDSSLWHCLAQHKGTKFFNMYGPTECTIDVTIGQITPTYRPHIGSPVLNMNVHIVDDNLMPVPAGIVGEICATGQGVARGYLNRESLTQEKFVTSDKQDICQGTLYRTGDLGRWRNDGRIEYVGRNDGQVKIRGYRIEKGEIAAQLNSIAGIKQCAVIVDNSEVTNPKLIAYYVASEGEKLTPSIIRNQLASKLAEYMIPSAFVCVDLLPLNHNGKLDERALPAPDAAAVAIDDYQAPIGETEQVIAEIWQSLFNVQKIGRHDNFFSLGGHSILGIMLLSQIKKQLSVEIPLRVLLESPQLSEFALAIDEPCATTSHKHLVYISKVGTKSPLFLIHPSEGEVTYAYDLASKMSSERPIYALAAAGLREGEVPHQTVEAMASAYIEEIRQVQPQGPYYIAGWSAGGTIAYEMAYQLIGQDQQVAFLGVFDSSSHYQYLEEAFAPICGQDFRNLSFNQWLQSLAWLPSHVTPREKEQIEQLMKARDVKRLIAYCQSKLILPQGVDEEAIRRHMALYYQMAIALVSYVKPELPIEIHAFVGKAQERKARPMQWQYFTKTVYTEVEGDHFTMMSSEHIESLSTALEHALNNTQQRNLALAEYHYHPVIDIQAGKVGQTPLYCIPGAGASVTSFTMLAQALGPDVPIIGLQPRGLCGKLVPHDSIESAARFYCDVLLAQNISGPINLIGHSFGGWVATELAKQLKAAGVAVNHLAVLDTPAPLFPDQETKQYHHIDMLLRLVEIYQMSTQVPLNISAESLFGLSDKQQIALILERLKATGIVPPNTKAELLQGVINVFKTNLNAQYQPQEMFDGEMTLTMARNDALSTTHADDEIAQITQQWRLHHDNISQWTAPGNHITLLSMPNVNALANWLNGQMR